MVDHFRQPVEDYGRWLAVWIGPFFQIDDKRQVELTASYRMQKVETLHIARSVEAEEMIGSYFKSGIACLTDILDEFLVFERAAFGSLYNNEAYTVRRHLVKIDISVVRADIDAYNTETVAVRINFGR